MTNLNTPTALLFPEKAGGLKPRMLERYYRTYYGYVLSVFKEAGVELTYGPDSAVGDGRFTVDINGCEILIDYSDHLTLTPGYEDHPYYFKFHCAEGVHDDYPNVRPFAPISFYDWEQYRVLKKGIKFKAHGSYILNRQKPYGNASFRRREVQRVLKARYQDKVLTEIVDQVQFWEDVNRSLVAVCVPGFRNDILDRGQWQLMAMGTCTISPRITTQLPFGKKLRPGKDYLECRQDYADVVEKIEWCRTHPKECQKIGRSAAKLFEQTGTPERLLSWIKEVIDG